MGICGGWKPVTVVAAGVMMISACGVMDLDVSGFTAGEGGAASGAAQAYPDAFVPEQLGDNRSRPCSTLTERDWESIGLARMTNHDEDGFSYCLLLAHEESLAEDPDASERYGVVTDDSPYSLVAEIVPMLDPAVPDAHEGVYFHVPFSAADPLSDLSCAAAVSTAQGRIDVAYFNSKDDSLSVDERCQRASDTLNDVMALAAIPWP